MSNVSNINQLEISQLKSERDRLRQKLLDIEDDYKRGLAPDSEDRAIDLENADVLEGIAKVTSEELASVEERLSKFFTNSEK